MNFYEDFDNYLANVIDSIKKILYARHEDIFDRLDFDNDDIYMEPLLYTYVNQTDDKWLDSIIYGYEKEKKQNIQVFSNSKGIIYLPKVGYFITNLYNTTINLETHNNVITLRFNDKIINYDFEPILLLSYNIELLKHQHPLLEPIFMDLEVNESEITISGVYKFHVDHINKGLDIIKSSNPEHFKLLATSLKKIMLFKGDKPHSFALMKAHNMIFLNVKDSDNEVFFVDHISHEGAHVTFNTITYESKYDLFTCNYNESFAKITNQIKEHSTIYLRFHGLFTYFEITKSLEQCMIKGNLSSKNNHEVKGRFTFHLRRFKMAIQDFENLNVFKKEGLEWLQMFKIHYYRLEKDYKKIIDQFQMNDQPYDFNSEIFERQNPISVH